MSWRPQLNILCFTYALPKVGEVTKRRVISILDRLYDRLGLFSPVVVLCNIFTQRGLASN